MEFKRLADVDIVETASDTDKVLIEQNGEIKRVPKTEVGGGNFFRFDANANMDTGEIADVTTNMTLAETIAAINNRELIGAYGYISSNGGVLMDIASLADVTPFFGVDCVTVVLFYASQEVFWTADGFSIEPPAPAKS